MNYTNITENINIYFHEIRKFQNMTKEDEDILFFRVANGDNSAVTEIFNRMAKLAVATAKTYTSNPDLLQDLIQEANCGILEAIRRFNPSMGFRFSSYARWWMKANISKFLNESMTVHPANGRLIAIAKRIRQEFFKENQREITEWELMDLLEERGEVVTDITAILSVTVDSIDNVTGDGDSTFEESRLFNSRSAIDNDYLCVEESESLTDDIDGLMSKLTIRERMMVKMKFGIGFEEMEYPDIAKKWARMTGEKVMSAERVRQIVVAAVKKMRNM